VKITVEYVCSVCKRRLDAVKYPFVPLADGTFACEVCADAAPQETEPE
jgi:DNA-directed RNA polymerase subunit RPC12/RpoP